MSKSYPSSSSYRSIWRRLRGLGYAATAGAALRAPSDARAPSPQTVSQLLSPATAGSREILAAHVRAQELSQRLDQHSRAAGVDLAVREGEFLAIIGPSGSGKSTLLHLLGTLDRPDAGEICFDGKRIDNLPAAGRDIAAQSHFGMIFQFYHLLPELSALENVLSPAMIADGVFGYLVNRSASIASGQADAGTGRPGAPPEAQAARTFRRRNAADGDCPGADRRPAGSAGRRTDRQPRSHTGEEILQILRGLNARAKPHYRHGDARLGHCRTGRPNRTLSRRPGRMPSADLDNPRIHAGAFRPRTIVPCRSRSISAGKFYAKEDAKISVYDHGLLYGDGVFEGLRSYGGKVFRLREHI